MITIVETIRAVSDLIEQIFGEVPTSKDITKGYDRPCTYVQPTGIETERSGGLRHDTYSLQIIRFAEKSYIGYQDLLKYQVALTDALENPVFVSEYFALYPENVSFELRRDEMVLLCEFSVQNIQELPEDDAGVETMETLNLRRKD